MSLQEKLTKLANEQPKLRQHVVPLLKEAVRRPHIPVKGTIYLPTNSAIAVWTHEILGQMSDGMWENARPDDHWMFWHDLKIAKGAPAVKVQSGGSPSRTSYGFAGLLPVIGDRMVALGKMGTITDDEDMLHAAEYMPATLEEWTKGKETGKWPYSFVGNYMAKITPEIAERFYRTNYSMSNLKSDLKLITTAIKNVSHGG